LKGKISKTGNESGKFDCLRQPECFVPALSEVGPEGENKGLAQSLCGTSGLGRRTRVAGERSRARTKGTGLEGKAKKLKKVVSTNTTKTEAFRV